MARPTVVVVGGGIAGLTAAWDLAHHQPAPDIHVLEASRRFGGKLWSDDLLGHQVDFGADAFLARQPYATGLCEELGLSAELVSPSQSRAYLLISGELRPFPEKLLLGVPADLEALRSSGLISPAGIERASLDLRAPSAPIADDTTVGALVRERLGDEVFETLVAPLLGGVNAGDADELSLRAGAAQLAEAAREGSLIKGARTLLERADPSAPAFASLRGGAGSLAGALASRLTELGVALHPGTSATDVAMAGQASPMGARRRRYAVALSGTAGGLIEADAVVLATPSFVTARLLERSVEAVAAEMASLEYASVAVVVLAYQRPDVEHPLDGSGFLVPEREGLLTTACSFGSSKWPHWSDPDVVLLRASAGRHHDTRIADLDDRELVARVIEELRPLLGLGSEPVAKRVVRWANGLPQYRPGHLRRVEGWELALQEHLPGVVIAGAACRGLGVPACVDSGRRAARTVAEALGLLRGDS